MIFVVTRTRNIQQKSTPKMVCFLLVTRTGISDTLKREPSESVVAIAPRANLVGSSPFPCGAIYSKTAHH